MTEVSDFNYYVVMSKLNKILMIILIGLASVNVPVGTTVVAGESYLWPMKITPRLSSQFGDYRAGHWHSGIDITTNGKPGYRIYAVEDGYIFRVRTAFWGYGKSLYVKLSDGRYAVYGHLDGFSPKLDNYLKSLQMKNNTFYQDLFFKSDDYPVKKGDYIALSGQSGAGAPHLHLEIRDQSNLPLNPLKQVYNMPDNTPPRVDYLAISRFKNSGFADYHEYEFLSISGTEPDLTVADTISLYDQLAFAIAAYDPGGSYNYGIYGSSIAVDGTEIFVFNNDQLDYESGGQIDYVRDTHLKRLVEDAKGNHNDNDRNVFYRLYVQPFDNQSFYGDYRSPAGILNAEDYNDSVHRVTISLYDVNGNTTTIRLYVKKATLTNPVIEDMIDTGDSLVINTREITDNSSLQIQKRRSAVAPYKDIPVATAVFAGTISCNGRNKSDDYRLRLAAADGSYSPWVSFNPSVKHENVTAYADLLELIIKDDDPVRIDDVPLHDYYALPLPGGYKKILVPTPTTNGYFTLALKDNPSPSTYYAINSSARVYSPDSSVYLDLTDDYLYGPTLIYITDPVVEKAAISFSISPDDLLFRNKVTINFNSGKFNLKQAKTSLYYYSPGKNRWYYVGKQSGELIKGETTGGGKFGLIEDNQPPTISRVKPGGGRTTTDRTPYLSCSIDDDLSGISKESQLEMLIDGLWIPAYYDIDSRKFSYQVQHPLRTGNHVLQINAIDNQGNKASVKAKFTIK